MRIGVLAIQGSFALHVKALASIGIDVVEVRYTEQLPELDGIIIPGGESTTFHIILESNNLGHELPQAIRDGLPAWGSCAGSIMLGTGTERPPRWNLLDVEVIRNGYGRQVDSFVAPLDVNVLDEPFSGVFIRAPRLTNIRKSVEIIASYSGDPVMVRQGHILATTFHPELTPDSRIHRFFVDQICQPEIHQKTLHTTPQTVLT